MIRTPRALFTRPLRFGAAGFTLVEVLIATALLSFSLVVMFGFHAQAVRSNLHARKVTDCTYLAQGKMEELLAIQWDTVTGRPTDLTADFNDASGWNPLYHPDNGALPMPVNAVWEDTDHQTTGMPLPTYYITWDVDDMNASGTWIRIRVRCAYEDPAFNSWNGATLSAYRYQDVI